METESREATLREVRELYDAGRYVSAYRRGQALGPLQGWQGTSARVLAGRLALNIGAPRLGRALQIRAWRADRGDPHALCFYAYSIYDRRGPLEAWKAVRDAGEYPQASGLHRSDLFALRADLAGVLRDFDTAEHWLSRAFDAGGERQWLHVVRSRLLERQDRHEEALAEARRSLEIRPSYRPGVHAAAELLLELGREQEALRLLRDSLALLESPGIASQLASLERELGLLEEADAHYALVESLSPLLEPQGLRWLEARRSDVAYDLGRVDEAAERAGRAGPGFHARIAERLRDPSRAAAPRVLLPVGFTLQHHVTCAPATLSTLAAFFGKPAEHLALAEEICYDGTPAHSERRWAERNGWIVREFRVDARAAQALVDRGLPFALTTVEPTSAHLQAVIGFDARRGTLLVRDPSVRRLVEFMEPEFSDRYRSTGPRAMLMVPADRPELLAGLELPEAGLYDLLYAVEDRLFRHDRAGAWKAYEELRTLAPGHRLAVHARRILAIYDGDRPVQSACVEAAAKLFPGDPVSESSRFQTLRDFGTRAERLELLRGQVGRDDVHPVFWQHYARELFQDARSAREARAAALEALRRSGPEAGCISLLADLSWEAGEREESLELYRFAACLEDKDENAARSYFQAARHLRQTASALLFLKGRFARFGRKSAAPARTLFWAYDQLDRTPEAFAVLDEAMGLRPDDGELVLFAAESRARYGDAGPAAELVRRAEGRAHRMSWLRASARLASLRGDLGGERALWREVLAVQPLAMDALAASARLAGETEGLAAARAFLAGQVERFPHHAPLAQLRIEWLRDAAPGEHEAAIRALLETSPEDPWAHRELAILLSRLSRLPEALEHAALARTLEPSPGSWDVEARILLGLGRKGEAQEAWKQAIRRSVDADDAIRKLVDSGDTAAERKELLAFVRGELVRQVIFGDGLLTYSEVAESALEPAELRAHLEEALAARPDLWHAWSALISRLAEAGDLEESRKRAREAVERFPLVPRLWLDLARTERLRGDAAAEREALRQALKISPGWDRAARELADSHERAGEFEAAREVLEQACRRSPLDAVDHGYLAHVLWRTGRREEAAARLQRAVGLDPAYSWGWSTLADWAGELGRPELVEAPARELVQRAPGDARVWLILARVLRGEGREAERGEALDRAIALRPDLDEARDLKAVLLAEQGRFEEALAVCDVPGATIQLRGRAAWVESRRSHRQGAIRRMEEAVRDEPGYAWGWRNLAQWYLEEKSTREYLKAAEHLVKLTPQSEVALGYRGDARRQTGDRAGAKADFRRAVEIEPSYEYGLFSLIDMLLEDGELDEAEKAVRHAGVHTPGPELGAFHLRLLMKRGKAAEALAAFRTLVRDLKEDSGTLQRALGAFTEPGQARKARGLLLESLLEGDRPSWMARVWAERVLEAGGLRELRKGAKRLRGRGEAWAEAASSEIEALAKQGSAWTLRWRLWREGERLREHALTWGSTGFAFATLGWYRRGSDWMAAPPKSGVKPWMLLQKAVLLRGRGRDAEAAAQSKSALAMHPDHTYAFHCVWMAFDEAVGGDAARALERLGRIDLDGLGSHYRAVHGLACAAALARTGAPWGKVRARLEEARACDPWAMAKNPLMRRTYRRALRTAAGALGGMTVKAWAFWKRLTS
jgi:tetratricopeptide (TPR) repeat protein